jgi:hypothetical protein
MMFRLRSVFNSLIFLGLVLLVSSGSVRAGVTCPTASCQYLPIVSSPSPVQVMQIEYFGWLGQTLRVKGEIANMTDISVYDVEVEISVYNYNQQLLGTISGATVLTATLPGQVNLFDLGTNFYPGDVGNVSARITDWSLTNPQLYIAPTLVMTEVQYIFNGYTVAGEIRNDTLIPITNVQGWSWTLDQLTHTGALPIVEVLQPGETASFGWTVNNYYTTPSPPVRIVVQGFAPP